VGVLKFSKNPEAAQKLKSFILSARGKDIFLSHAYAVGAPKIDKEGFLQSGDPSTDQLMQWLVKAAELVKQGKRRATQDNVGLLLAEVLRQQKTIRAGD
jgi:ABC-type Fe3+ transport system substrate-binding protein